ncbi:pyridoxal phosphate-dependent transferase [Aspergillus bertholletiae]|uniref:Pyridoxal phosphate-dependent transferase n=1 Tax=Aspergillus bertholletiae TaxID=1226010 RepID=A0A5N7AP38_9EURO|nr:pyridoxal phosphate-dependent transferase [Aspergillus bertholletiae]
MVKIREFAVEQWMNTYENDAKYNLAETCCASISLNDLMSFSGQQTSIIDYTQKQVYGAIRGSTALRSNIAKLYATESSGHLSPGNVLVTNGAIQANFLALYTSVGPGDHVICHYPTYQQLYSVPEACGAEVDLWRSKEDAGWQLDLQELRSLIKPNTKLIIINNPQNPTGAVLSRDILQGIVDIARQHSIMIHSDEVYRPLFHSVDTDQQEHSPSILSLGYDNVVVTGSMSKAFSLAGIRLGWIVSRSSATIEACAATRDYTVISVGQLDDRVATLALSTPTVHNLLERNIQLARQNLAALDTFIEEFEWAIEWTRPQAGTTAFIKFVNREGKLIDDVIFCQQLQKQTGVMLVPGSLCFGDGVDFKGYVRIGYVQEPQVLVDGLQGLREFMRNGYEQLPVATA